MSDRRIQLSRAYDKALPWAMLLVIALVMGTLFFLPPAYTTAAAKEFLNGPHIWAVVGFFVGVGVWFWTTKDQRKAAKLKRTYFEALWSPLNDSQLTQYFKYYIIENSEPAKAQGYVPVGAHLVKEKPVRIQTACLLHPNGHSVVHIVNKGTLQALEIHSFLDDGSVIASSNLEDAVTKLQREFKASRRGAKTFLAHNPELNTDLLYSQMAPHGFLVHLFPKAKIEELIEEHDRLLKAVLDNPRVGLRKLTARNWREYVLYASRHFSQLRFDLGKLDNAPQPFTFPTGELVKEDYTRRSTGTPTETIIALIGSDLR